MIRIFAMTNLRFTKQRFTLLAVLIVLSFTFVSDIAAEVEDATLSGRVITAEGEPVAGASIMLQISTAITDSEGRFTFTEITPGQTRLKVLRNPMMAKGSFRANHTKVRAIKFGSVTFYPHDFHDTSRSATFAIEPGADIKDVEIIMERQLIVRSRIVFKNGEPLANMSLKINVDHLGLDGTGGDFGFNRPVQTDADGNFVHATNTPGIYVLSYNHRGLSAASDPFIIEAAKPHETVVLTLNGNISDLFVSPPEKPQRQRRHYPSNIAYVPGVWIINPANGHAYKWNDCEDRADAQAQAAVEEAHLVTITTEAEQIWIEAVFGHGPYWIGLTDVEKEGEWQWETGEPVIYTNWKEDNENEQFLNGQFLMGPPAFLEFLGVKGEKQFREEDERDFEEEHKDFVIMSDSGWDAEIGKWQTTHPEAARMAILEKI
ncbi:hypothetical protein F4167_20165, partial [Candidatus Poribacteria bacterium]|nr:hypothetical protein [Candidatus Poribacteria bacterium]